MSDILYWVISEPCPLLNPTHSTELAPLKMDPENPENPALLEGSLVETDPVKLIKPPSSVKRTP